MQRASLETILRVPSAYRPPCIATDIATDITENLAASGHLHPAKHVDAHAKGTREDKEGARSDSQLLRPSADMWMGLPRSRIGSRHSPVVQAQVAVISLLGRISGRRILPLGHRR